MDEILDRQLIENYLNGDEASFSLIVNRYLKLVVNFANTFVQNRATAEDVAQEVFIKAWKNLKKFKLDASFKTWLLVIAKNTCLDYLRKQKREFANVLSLPDLEEDGQLLPDMGPLPNELFAKMEANDLMNNILSDFSGPDKLIVALYYYEQMTFEEIASAFTLLLGLENVKVNYPERLAQAITWHKQGLDFADALHLVNSQHCKKLYTFDKKMITKAKHLEGSKVLAPDL